MNDLTKFNIPFSGLKNEVYQYDFQVDTTFFETYDHSLIENGTVNVHLIFDKQPSFFRLNFSYTGTIQTDCDRCSELFEMPISGNHQLIVRFSEVPKPEEEELIFIKPSETALNVAPLIYEVIHLGLPFRKACEEKEDGLPSCDSNILDYLMEEEEIQKEEDSKKTVWSELKNLKIN